MKNIYFSSNILPSHIRFIFSMASVFFTLSFSFAQTNFYNGGTDITVYPNTILFVDGNVSNTVQGFIHNQGDIYLTGDWTNSEPLGCLDPSTGTVIFSGVSQTIQGTQTTTFNNLDMQGVGTKTLDINTIVAGNTGVLSLNATTLDLNSKTLIVTNPASTAISRTSGYILSETDPGTVYGRVQWNLGNTSSNYTFPFGTISGTYIPFLYDVTSAGNQSGVGNISVATYPTTVTSIPNNRPLPSGVTNLNSFSGAESDVTCADRFWIVDAANYSSKPTANLTFTYRDEEWDLTGGSTNDIIEDSLKGWMWSGIQWQNPASGISNVGNNTVKVTGINSSGPWTLNAGDPPPYICSELTTPNAFSPNNDGRSDLFILQGWEKCVSSFYFAIYNRWGEKVFETENIAQGWDGTYKGKPLDPAVFVYYIKAKDLTGEEVNKKGNISLIR